MFLRNLFWLTLFLAATAIFVAFGCSSDDSPTGTDGDNPDQDSINQVLSEQLVTEANDELGELLDEMINETIENADSSFRPDDIDFSSVYNLYSQALLYWPDNDDAKFGCAFTGLMLFLGDDDLNDLVDRFKDTYDTLSYNPLSKVTQLPEVALGDRDNLVPNSIPTSPSGALKVLPALTSLDNSVIRLASADPSISDIQACIESNLLPKLVEAREYLVDIMSDPDYTFTVTPLMQGNPGANPIVLDRSDFSLFLGVIYSAEAALHVFFSRNLDIGSYTAEGVTAAADQDSDFLTLKSGGVGQSHMTTSKSRVISALAQFETTVDYLLEEIGTDQTNDLIKVYTSDVEDLNDIKDSLEHYSSFFDGIHTFNVFYNRHWTCDWYEYYFDCWIEEDTLELQVDLSKFFDNPVVDPKDCLPGYTVSLEVLEDYYKDFADLHFDRGDYWSTLYLLYGLEYPYDTSSTIYPYFTNHLPDDNTDEFYALLNTYDGTWGYQQFVFGWDDVYLQWGDETYPWGYYSRNAILYRSYYREPDQLYGCFEWDANSFEEWTWPNPTLNGLLVNMTSDKIKDLITDEVGEWSKGDCDFVDIDRW